jgi:ubiquinone/menaquinone biosynthesis C-methylase UbiE
MIKRWHGANILPARQTVIGRHISRLIKNCGAGAGTKILDVGCGDGVVGDLIAKEVGNGSQVQGLETSRRGDELIDVQVFDGQNLPYRDGEFDYVVLSDVLHHLNSFGEQSRLFAECVRVSKKGVCVKDHVEKWLPDRILLGMMDVVGNAGRGVFLSYNYLNEQQWQRLLHDAGAEWGARIDSPLGIHPAWVSWISETPPWGSKLHFVGIAVKAESGKMPLRS